MMLILFFSVFSGEMRQVHCHIYFCRKSDFDEKLEKWKCTGCAQNTPECKVSFQSQPLKFQQRFKDYQLRRKRRNLSSNSQEDILRAEKRSARKSRKLQYRKMKRLALKKKRSEEREALKRKRADEQASRRRKKKALRILSKNN